MKFSISSARKKTLFSKLQTSGALGDFPTFIKCQGLLMYFDSGMDLGSIADFVNRSYECVRGWLDDYILHGVDAITPKRSPGRPSKLSKSQLKELAAILGRSPCDAGYSSGCWNAAMIVDLIKKLFKVSYSAKYLPQLLGRMNFSYQKAKFISAKADEQKRGVWLEKTWPNLLRRAKRNDGVIMFGDESSFALWGSLSYTWSPKGEQPLVPTNGNRRCLKVFGAIEFFSGKLISQIIEGKLNANSYIIFLRRLIGSTDKKIFLVEDGAPYHRSRAVKDFLNENKNRIQVERLPSYSPDFNPIELLWRNIKRAATHNVFFNDLDQLKLTLSKQLTKMKRTPEAILNLFGFYSKATS